jgi:hypothetical protein
MSFCSEGNQSATSASVPIKAQLTAMHRKSGTYFVDLGIMELESRLVTTRDSARQANDPLVPHKLWATR